MSVTSKESHTPLARQAAVTTATFTLALTVYWFTLAPDLTWAHHGADGGELITAAVTLGVPHPPGYPTYVLLGKLISYVPIGTVAYRFNLFSAVCAAGAAAFLALTIQQSALFAGRSHTAGPALAAGLTLALTPLVWQQAVIAEVYALNLALVAALVWAALCRQPAWLVGCLWGLSLTTHLTSLLLLPLVLVTLPRPAWRQFPAGVLAGLTPWLAIFALAHTASPVVWGEPTTLEGWWWLVSGRLYRPNLFNLSLEALGGRLSRWLPALPAQFGYVGWLALPFGLVNSAPAAASKEMRRLPFILLATAALFAVYALGYSSPNAAVYGLPALLFLTIVLTLGLYPLRAGALLLPLVLLTLHFSSLRHSRMQVVRPLAEPLLSEAPADALLLTDGTDRTTFALWYFHYVERQRPDVIVVDRNLLAFDWYRQRLQAQQPTLKLLEQDDLSAFKEENARERPLCEISLETQTILCSRNNS